jgi:hypothetical protein
VYCKPNLFQILDQASHPARAMKFDPLIRMAGIIIAGICIFCMTLMKVDQRPGHRVKDATPAKSCTQKISASFRNDSTSINRCPSGGALISACSSTQVSL